VAGAEEEPAVVVAEVALQAEDGRQLDLVLADALLGDVVDGLTGCQGAVVGDDQGARPQLNLARRKRLGRAGAVEGLDVDVRADEVGDRHTRI
jgi:hypothetical protein